ncbi:MAG TPA: NADP-dependent oxidoreductase [Mycobacterium sp.]|jgi:NADPH-dependent curcumin reductase|nr:NADP-dependent oxidoreductase [Mycobacterium sp.]
MITTAHRFVLVTRPVGEPSRDNFRLEEVDVPEPGPGQVLLRSRYLSLDPYVRGRIGGMGSTYAGPTPIGSAPPGDTVSVVIKSEDPSLSVGDVVLANIGWQTHALADARAVRKLDPAAAPVTTALGVLGMPGLTAYSGLLNIGKPRQGETVVVAAAAGPVGSLVGQLARIRGARAVGIAGGPAKIEYVGSTLGFDAAVDHRAADFATRLAAASPNGIDVYFENVGGDVFNAVFPLLNPFARVPVCGLVSGYNKAQQGWSLPPDLLRQVLSKSLTIRGFAVTEFWEEFDRFHADVAEWIRDGKIRYREDIVDEFENTPDAFRGLLRGENLGKLIVRVSE